LDIKESKPQDLVLSSFGNKVFVILLHAYYYGERNDEAQVILQDIDGVCVLECEGISMKLGLLCQITYFHYLIKYYF